MKVQVLITIVVIFAIAIIKIVQRYMLEHNLHKDTINEIENKKDNFINKNYKWILTILILVMAITRLYKFGKIPEYIGVDEAGAAYDAYCLANYGVDRYLNKWPLYLINFGGGQSALYAYSTIPFIKLFGANIVSYRLPELIFFIMGIIVSYVLVDKFKDKKTALLYAFLIIICPWHIEASRNGLDCNLLAPMFMLDVLLLLIAKKDWHYVIAGIAIGITLYTYALSWILIPVFLLFYIIYSLYMKNIKFKQIIILGIPIVILAMPLIYLILLNRGYVSETRLGIFTIPKLPFYREGEIQVFNILKYGTEAIRTVFINKNSIYIFIIPFFIVGLIEGISDFIFSLARRKFSLDGFLTITFLALYITNLTVEIGSINKINIVYIPLLYVTTIGIIKLCEKSYIIPSVVLTILCVLFINFEIEYFDTAKTDIKNANEPYSDKEIYTITEQIEADPNNRDADKYFIVHYKAEPYIYPLLEKKISPYELTETKNKNPQINIPHKVSIFSFDDYSFWERALTDEAIDMINNREKYIVVINKRYTENIEKLQVTGTTTNEYGTYKIIKNY